MTINHHSHWVELIQQVMNAVVTMVDTAPAILHIHVYVGMVGLDCCVTLLFVIHHVITQEYVSDLMSVPVNQVTQEPAVKKPLATLPVRMEDIVLSLSNVSVLLVSQEDFVKNALEKIVNKALNNA